MISHLQNPDSPPNPFGSAPPDSVESSNSGRRPDPGSRAAGLVAILIALICFGAVVFLNQASNAPSNTQRAAEVAAGQRVEDLGDPATLALKMVVKLAHLFDPQDRASREEWLKQARSPVTDPTKRSESERVREAIVHAEVLKGQDGAGAAAELLDQMEAEFADRPDRLARKLDENEQARIDRAREDIALLRRVFAGEADKLSDGERQHLIDRHGWFGELALTFGRPDEDPARTRLLAGGLALILGIVFVFAAGIGAVVGGTGCFIAMVVMIATGKVKRRFVPPAPGGSFGWEMLAAFVFSFLLFKVLASLLAGALSTGSSPPPWFGHAVLIGQWLVAGSILFPLLRGVRFDEYRRLVGWTAERGLFREIGAGIFGYLAGLPVIFAALLFSLVLNFAVGLWRGGEAPPPENPILELAGRGDALLLVLLFTLATIWAPLVEETVFRGGVYRAMRTRVGFVLAAIASALIFGFMHGYPVALLGPVISIGFVFALIREWRGSIVGPIVAHFLNNATILAILFLVVSAAG